MRTLSLSAAVTTLLLLAAGVSAAPPGGAPTTTAPAASPGPDDESAARRAILQALFYERLTIRVEDMAAREVFDYLGPALGVPLVARYSDDPAGHGIDPGLPVTVSREEAPALEVLELVLEQCSVFEACTWQVRRGFLEVGTVGRLGAPSARRVRWYPVQALLHEPRRFDDAPSLRLDDALRAGVVYSPGTAFGGYGSGRFFGGGAAGASFRVAPAPGGGGAAHAERAESLIDLIVQIVEPAAWMRNGGDRASIGYRDGMLVVNAPPYLHRRIFGTGPVPPPERQPEPEREPEPEPEAGPDASEAGASYQTPGSSR